MKVYISCDLEGVAGVCLKAQQMPDRPEYADAVRLLAGEVSAAVEGCLDGGADEVLVADMHFLGRNIKPEWLHPKARLIQGGGHYGPRLAGLDESVSCMLLVGYHAMAGTLGAVLDHTMSSHYYSVEVNGRAIGEMAWDGALAGEKGVPLVFVASDDKGCAEARDFFGPGIETAETKRGILRHRAVSLSPEESQNLIRHKAKAAMARAGSAKPFTFDTPCELVIHTWRQDTAEDLMTRPGARRLNARDVAFTLENWSDFTGGG